MKRPIDQSRRIARRVHRVNESPLAPTADAAERFSVSRAQLRALLDRFSNYIHEDGTVYATLKLDEIIDVVLKRRR